MATYDVRFRDRVGAIRNAHASIQAASPSEAVMLARRSMTVPPGVQLFSVYRHRRLRGRRLVGTFPVTGNDDGLAGVREPRRPLPTPPSLRAEAELPAYPDI